MERRHVRRKNSLFFFSDEIFAYMYILAHQDSRRRFSFELLEGLEKFRIVNYIIQQWMMDMNNL